MIRKIILLFILVLGLCFTNIGFAELTARDIACALSGDCIDTTDFVISVDDISPGMKVQGGNMKENVNYALGSIIQTAMVALGSLALLVMTVGAGYMIIHHGRDEFLSKGKAIFMSGVIALAVALGSYYLVAILTYILYN